MHYRQLDVSLRFFQIFSDILGSKAVQEKNEIFESFEPAVAIITGPFQVCPTLISSSDLCLGAFTQNAKQRKATKI